MWGVKIGVGREVTLSFEIHMYMLMREMGVNRRGAERIYILRILDSLGSEGMRERLRDGAVHDLYDRCVRKCVSNW